MAQTYSSACNTTILSIKVKSMLMPPYGAEKLASRLEPPEYGTGAISSNSYAAAVATYS